MGGNSEIACGELPLLPVCSSSSTFGWWPRPQFGSNQAQEPVDGEAGVSNNRPQQWLLDGPARMDWNDGSRFRLGMHHNEMAPSLAVLNKSRTLERAHHLPRGQRRKLGHESSRDRHGNRDPSLKRLSLLGNRLPVSREALQIQRDSLLDVAPGFFQGVALRVAARQCRHRDNVASFWSLLVENRIGEFPGSLAGHHLLHCSGSHWDRQRDATPPIWNNEGGAARAAERLTGQGRLIAPRPEFFVLEYKSGCRRRSSARAHRRRAVRCRARGGHTPRRKRYPRGSRTQNSDPTPGVLVRLISPPCCSAIHRAIERPSPVPPVARERSFETR